MRRLWWRFFGQGSGKVQEHFVERCGRQLVCQHFHCVVRDDAHVRQLLRLDREQAVPDSRRMNLDADEIGIRRTRGECDEGIAIAKPDFQDARRDPAECAVEVERRSLVCNSEAGQELVERAPLCLGDPAGAKHVTPDRLPRSIHAFEIRSEVSAAMFGQPFSASVRSSSSARIASARSTPARPPAARP